MYCFYCKKKLDGYSEFCGYCGKKLDCKDDAPKIYNEGYYHYIGAEGRPKDYKKAIQYFARAAYLDYVEAINYMGLIYLNGEGVEANTTTALNWFNHALSINPEFGRAHYNIGRIFCCGIRIKKNIPLAYKHLMFAIKYGRNTNYYPYACNFVGYILMEEYKKPKESLSYFWESVRYAPDMAESWHNLGLLREKGYYALSEKDKREDYYYLKAAKLGYAKSMESMGRYYYKISLRYSGSERRKFANISKEWFEAAASKGGKHEKNYLTFIKAASYFLDESEVRREVYESRSNSSSSSSILTGNTPTIQQSNQKQILFKDGRGNLNVSGGCFYDFRDNLIEWGDPFYDSRGNYIQWGSPFYDGKGNYIQWGNPFYDAAGNYINPN